MSFRLQMPFKTGGSGEPELSSDSAQLVQSLHGKHYEDALAGRVFSHTPTPLGLAIPIYTGTALAGGMPIWNPTGSGVNVELISANIAKASGTTAFAAAMLMARTDAGSQLTTGSEITAFAETTPFNGFLGGGTSSRVRSSNAGTVTVTAGVAAEAVRTLFGMVPEIDTSANAPHQMQVDFNGTVIVPPGVLVWVAATKATVALFSTTLVWKEIPA